jgi:hypothetical protein
VNSPPPQSPQTALSGEAVHALSNHLAVILGFIELILHQTREDDPRRLDMVEIRNAAFEAARIIGRPVDERGRDSGGPGQERDENGANER